MGLISEYGKQLIGKIFFFHAEDRWCIGRITDLSDDRAIYKPLGRSNAIILMNPDSFGIRSNIDSSSRLIKDSQQLEKYLELFNGTNQ